MKLHFKEAVVLEQKEKAASPSQGSTRGLALCVHTSFGFRCRFGRQEPFRVRKPLLMPLAGLLLLWPPAGPATGRVRGRSTARGREAFARCLIGGALEL